MGAVVGGEAGSRSQALSAIGTWRRRWAETGFNFTFMENRDDHVPDVCLTSGSASISGYIAARLQTEILESLLGVRDFERLVKL